MKNILSIFLVLAIMSCNETDRPTGFPHSASTDTEGIETLTSMEKNSEEHIVTIMDKGLQLAMCQYTVPAGWDCIQDVANNPSDGMQMRHQVDFFSTDNQLMRNKGTLAYYHILGTNRDMMIQKLVQEGCQDVSQLKMGQMTLNKKVMNDPATMQKMSAMLPQGTQFEQLEIPFTGVRNGQSIQGRVDISHFGLQDYSGQISGGQVTVRLLMSSPTLFTSTEEIASRIDKSFKSNPAHGQMVAQIMSNTTRQIDANTAANTRAHEQRMANMQQNFDAHQQKMSGMQQSFDQQNQQWMDRNFGNSGTSSNNGYGNHEQFIDQIYEQSTLADPSGYNVQRDGQYNYWYTDGQGHYHGTDDINFDPSTLGSGWYQTEALKP